MSERVSSAVEHEKCRMSWMLTPKYKIIPTNNLILCYFENIINFNKTNNLFFKWYKIETFITLSNYNLSFGYRFN